MDEYSVVSHREHRTWIAWLDKQWNEPDRHDYYQMRTAQAIVACHVKDSKDITLDSFKVQFVEANPERDSANEADEISKRQVAARIEGFGTAVVVKDWDGNIVLAPEGYTEPHA